MPEKTLAALKVAPSTTELREFDLPDVPPDAALLKVEVAGVCGTDVSQYKLPLRGAPLIMGHENVGYLAKVGSEFARHKGFKEGDLVFLEHYLPCGHCEWDHMGEYRHCAATEWFYDPKAIRYGYTAISTAPSLWGGFAHYVYLPLNAVLHRVPEGLSPEIAGIATPMSNGIQWTLMDGGVGYASTVLIQGPGQQGLCCAMAAKQAGASCIIVTGTSKDARRLEVAKPLGADEVIDVTKRMRSRASWRSPAAAASTSSSIAAAAEARRRCCWASRPPSAGAERWSCRARATRPSRIFRWAGSPGKASRSRARAATRIGRSSSRCTTWPRTGSRWS